MEEKLNLKSPTEYQEQQNYFEIVELHKTRYPQLNCISATQNGLYSTAKHVNRMKRAGLKPGYPDLIVDIPSRGYHGARIELKRRGYGNKMSKAQTEWFSKLTEQGYWCFCTEGWESAWEATLWYLEIRG